MPNGKRISSSQILLAIFFITLIANTVFCYWVGTGFVQVAQEMHAVEDAGGDPSEVQVDENLMGSGRLLVIFNIPLLVTVGAIAREAEPSIGIGFWVALILGSTYVPAIITFMMYIWFTPPHQRGPLPGVDWDSEDFKKGDEDERTG